MVIVFFAWAFAWEIGGRNIPNDWSDLEEDQHLGITTVPVRYGRKNASWISFGFVSAIVILSLLFPMVAPLPHVVLYLAGAAASGIVLLLLPISRWLRRQTPDEALRFFNMACFYPLAVFGWLAIAILV